MIWFISGRLAVGYVFDSYNVNSISRLPNPPEAGLHLFFPILIRVRTRKLERAEVTERNRSTSSI
ncbi:unnamed protein product [Enterobius vermicularis]|uniref:Uncharacterized protein n=1 Tax=Enterobius vermicularis TaxID=51028 RepID=A0A0N4VQD3_ENTVE|nr:unnamed protein product [Enterobius vermicularis]